MGIEEYRVLLVVLDIVVMAGLGFWVGWWTPGQTRTYVLFAIGIVPCLLGSLLLNSGAFPKVGIIGTAWGVMVILCGLLCLPFFWSAVAGYEIRKRRR